MYFKPADLKKLRDEYSRLNVKYADLLFAFQSFQFNEPEARKYAMQGFSRRIRTLKRCIENVYSISPPDKSDKPSDENLTDLAINLQSFILNIFGCIDNLAWIWAKENNFEYRNNTDVSFFKKKIHDILSSEFREYLDSDRLQAWLEYLKNYRHALAHRIPLYVVPTLMTTQETEKHHELEDQKMEILFNVHLMTRQENRDDLSIEELNELLSRQDTEFEKIDQLSIEQDNLGRFVPVMTYSYEEQPSPVLFHGQLLADWNTILELSTKFFDELKYQADSRKRSTAPTS